MNKTKKPDAFEHIHTRFEGTLKDIKRKQWRVMINAMGADGHRYEYPKTGWIDSLVDSSPFLNE